MTKKLIVGVLIAVLVALGLGGYFIYDFYNTSQKVVTSANNNVDILNANAETGKTLLDKIGEKGEALGNTEDSQISQIQEQVTEIEVLLNEAETLGNQTLEKVDTLDKGFNEDTEKVYNKSKTILEERSVLLIQTSQDLKNPLCVLSNIGKQVQSLEAASAAADKISSNTNDQGLINETKIISQEYQKVGDLIGQLEACFSGNFSQYYTDSAKAAVTEDKKFFVDLAQAYVNIYQGVQESNADKINQGTATATAAQSYEPKTYENQDITTAMESFGNSINASSQSISNQTDELNGLLDELGDKYWFDR